MEAKRARLRVLEKKREDYFRRVQLIYDLIAQLPDNEPAKNQFIIRYQTLAETRAHYYSYIDEISTLQVEIDDQVEPDFQSLTAFDDLYGAILIAYEKLNVPTNEPIMHRCSTTEGNQNQLPRLNFKHFSGKIKDWPEFRDLFKAVIINDKSLDNARKYYYLRSYLEPEALKIISSFPLSAEHFNSAWNALEERFEDKRLLAAHFFDELFSFEKPPIHQTAKSLQTFLTKFNDAVVGLTNMRVEDLSDLIVLNLALRRLDPVTVKAFERENVGTDFPKYDSLVKFVKKQLKVLEITAAETSSHSKGTSSDTSKSKNSKKCLLSFSTTNQQTAIQTTAPQDTTHSTASPMQSAPAFHPHYGSYYSSAALQYPPAFPSTSQCTPMMATASQYTNASSSAPHVSNIYPNTPQYANTSSYNSFYSPCPLCQAAHPLYKCYSFQQMSPEQRVNKVRALKACENCLSLTHPVKKCRSTSSCFRCQARHHTLIHIDVKIPTRQDQNKSLCSNTVDNLDSETNLSTQTKQINSTVVLGTALISLKCKDGTFSTCRALLDPASLRSCITESCVAKLGLDVTPRRLRFTGLGEVPVVEGTGLVKCEIKPLYTSEPRVTTVAVALPEILGPTPPTALANSLIKNYSEFNLADPEFGTPGPIDFLIGADLFLLVLTSQPNFHLKESVIHTIFGDVVMGPISSDAEPPRGLVSLCTAVDPLSESITRFWETEEVPITPILNPEDELCEKHFVSTHERNKDGRYIVRLPFKNTDLNFPESRSVAVKRFLSLEQRFRRNNVLKENCSSFLHEYENLGHMEKTLEKAEYVLPYFCVHNPHSQTTPVRVVFDGSAKASQRSLNDTLYPGPKLQKQVPDIIMNFRLHKFVFCCDIIKMFRQILLHDDDRKFTHIVYRDNPDEPLQEYRLNTVTYGLTPSPWHAQRVLIQLAKDEGDVFPAAARVLLEDTFMDDITTGTQSISSLISLADELIQLLRAGGFELSKWKSNSKEFLCLVNASSSSPLIISEDQTCKILGIRWEPTTDVLSYNIDLPTRSEPPTKRSVLSIIASIYDPLGFLSPLTFALKCFMQLLWTAGLAWDDHLTKDLYQKWHSLTSDLSCLSNIRLPRWILPQTYTSIQVLGFSDASERGYGCVIYLRVSRCNSPPHISLLLAKSKVAPLKGSTIPRLELAGALLLARSIGSLQPVFSKLVIDRLYLHTDSSIVLSWLNKPPHTLKMYVGNRVNSILEHTQLNDWRHISTDLNIADVVSRGLDAFSLSQCSEWFQGPKWIHQSRSAWPVPVWSPIPTEELPELKPTTAKVLLTEADLEKDIEWMSQFSSFLKIQKIQVYVSRFISWCRLSSQGVVPPSNEPISVSELRKALLNLVRQVQNVYFAKDILLIHSKQLKSSSLLPLTPFIDEQGLLRVGGRLKHANLPYSAQHPLLLPKHCHLTNVLIDHYHKFYLHAGPRTLRALLQKQFWILSAHSVIRQRIRMCLTCSRFSITTPSPMMADLPSSRVTVARPFSRCGVDLAGPFLIKESYRRNASSYKGYFALFICMVTKAVHLEALTSLSSEAFIATLTRFVARRGLPSDIYSDQATNFRGAARELTEIVSFLKQEDNQRYITAELAKLEINFHFICPRAPFMGGIWESNIKNTKCHLHKVVGDKILTIEEFVTMLARVEAVLNSRPLCDLSPSPNELEALTPGHFLIGAPLVAVPELDLTELPLNRLSRWQKVSQMFQHFWQRWSSEYLLTLQQKAKWFSNNAENLQVGQLVWVKEDGASPLTFPLGRIEEVFPNQDDGVVRIVSVRTSRGLYKRPVRKLAPLYLSE